MEVLDDTPHYDFPPFPVAPEGVAIIPFKDFQERGIRVFSNPDTGEEVDGLGIPTVELKAKHPETDECKSDAARYRDQAQRTKSLREALATSPGLDSRRWWEQWEDTEPARWIAGKCTALSPLDRFHQAATQFRKHRTWPPTTSGLSHVWDQFRLFAGLCASTPLWTKQEDKPASTHDASDSDSDSGDNQPQDPGQSEGFPASQKVYRKPGRPRAPYQGYGEDPLIVANEEDVGALLEEEEYQRASKAEKFLDNPAQGTAEFLSSYIRKQGLIWSEKNLIQIPRLVHFFIQYMYYTDVLTDKAGKDSIKLGMRVSEKAIQELPLSSLLSKSLPCAFSSACQQTFGNKSQIFEFTGYTSDSPSANPIPDGLGTPPQQGKDNQEEEPSPSGPDQPPDPPLAPEEPFFVEEDDDLAKREREFWGAGETDAWPMPETPSLLELLGPTAFPLTHATGIVEFSVRRIKSLMPSSQSASRTAKASTQPEAVEQDLRNKFSQVVFEPWLDWDITDEKDLAQPVILNTSVGAVIAERGDKPTDSKGPVHNPFEDEITVLVDNDVLQHMRLGMGVWARWVQLAREGIENSDELGSQKSGSSVSARSGKTKGKSGSSKKPKPTLWYIDQVSMVFPSYHVPTTY